jgi:hypothetical protein
VQNIWIEYEEAFENCITKVILPDKELTNVDQILIKSEKDLENIPEGGGSYWIWTNEPVYHSLHKNQTPQPLKGGEIIYNGIAKDDVKGRIRHHLFGKEDAKWSGISVDIYLGKSSSHRKKACCPEKKVAYINNEPIRSVPQLLKLFLSEEEKQFINASKSETIYFRNGINISDPIHNKFDFDPL